MKQDRHWVLVSRRWHNPDISIEVTSEDMEISMTLDDFIQALVKEAKNPTLLFSEKGLHKRLKEAALKVVKGMKKETDRIM